MVCHPCATDSAAAAPHDVPSTTPAALLTAEAQCDGFVASLPTSESSPEAQLLEGGVMVVKEHTYSFVLHLLPDPQTSHVRKEDVEYFQYLETPCEIKR